MLPPMKSVGSVIFSIVPWVSLLPSSSRSRQNSVGPTDRNSLPCRYQSPPLLTIILICLSSLFSLPKPQCLLPALRKQGFTVIVTDSWTCRLICAAFSVTTQCDLSRSGGGGGLTIQSQLQSSLLSMCLHIKWLSIFYSIWHLCDVSISFEIILATKLGKGHDYGV